VLLFLIGRIAFARGDRMTMITRPGGESSRWLGRLIDEGDLAWIGAIGFVHVRKLPRLDRDRIVPSLREAYAEMRRELGASPSPVLDTVLRRQRPAAFDALVVEPPSRKPTRAAVVFLHGYAGSWSFECWLVARAAAAIDALTVCPATDFQGHWSDSDGERIVRETMRWLQGRGLQTIYLAGLSNGGYGASLLAPRLRGLRGLVLISGASPTAPPADVPTLVVQGEADTMASPSSARTYAARTQARYASFPSGHFALLTDREPIRSTIATFLRATVP
jgi:pimeloyl-ACP methyl ester carboxylesterase